MHWTNVSCSTYSSALSEWILYALLSRLILLQTVCSNTSLGDRHTVTPLQFYWLFLSCLGSTLPPVLSHGSPAFPSPLSSIPPRVCACNGSDPRVCIQHRTP